MPDKAFKDITSIPYFAYEPGIMEWLCLIIFCIISVVILRIVFSIKNRSKNFKALDKAISELLLFNRSEITSPKETVFNASILARRLASYIYDPAISTLSETELKNQASKSTGKFADVLNALVELEKIKYRPDINQESARSALTALLNALQAYRQGEISK